MAEANKATRANETDLAAKIRKENDAKTHAKRISNETEEGAKIRKEQDVKTHAKRRAN